MKKLLSIILSLTMIVVPFRSNICSADDVKTEEGQVISKKEMVINKAKEVANFVAENSSKIIITATAVSLAAWPTLNGILNRSAIGDLYKDKSLPMNKKLISFAKILFLGKYALKNQSKLSTEDAETKVEPEEVKEIVTDSNNAEKISE